MSSFAVVKRAAIACIFMVALADAAHAAASCKSAAEHLATLIKNNWPSSNENATVDMISTFLHASPFGFIPGATRFKLAEYSQAAFVKQAAQLQRRFTPSNDC